MFFAENIVSGPADYLNRCHFITYQKHIEIYLLIFLPVELNYDEFLKFPSNLKATLFLSLNTKITELLQFVKLLGKQF